MNVNLHLERLILDGLDLPQRQRPQLQAAVEAELARLLAANGLPPAWRSGGAVPSVPGGTIQLTANRHPTHLGRQIAQAVYGGFGK